MNQKLAASDDVDSLSTISEDSSQITLAEIAYNFLLANILHPKVRCPHDPAELLYHVHLKIGYPNESDFLHKFHHAYISLKRVSSDNGHKCHFDKLLIDAYCQVYKDSSSLKLQRDMYIEEVDSVKSELQKFRKKITSGHARKGPVRFDAIHKAFQFRELASITYDELGKFFKPNQSTETEEKKRKYVLSAVSWFNQAAARLDIDIRIDVIKSTSYRIRFLP